MSLESTNPTFLMRPEIKSRTYNILRFGGILFLFLISLTLMKDGLGLMGSSASAQVISATSNPFVALFIGMLASSIFQSSSTVTTTVVIMVSQSVLTMENAVPMIMGANIGTSVTSSIVSFGHITKKAEFKRAVAAATAHDFFNIFVTIVVLPLELIFGVLSKPALFLASLMVEEVDVAFHTPSFLDVFTSPIAHYIDSLLQNNVWLIIVVSVVLLFASIRLLAALFKKVLIDGAEKKLNSLVFNRPINSFAWGTGVTMLMQSSSVSTSLMVPLVATEKVTLEKAFPFLMGANIGTTITALLASFAGNQLALAVAITHLLFNVYGVVFFFPFRSIRRIPLLFSEWLGKTSARYKFVAFLYVLFTFFIVPFLLIFFSK